MFPFDSYAGGGRKLLGMTKKSSARQGYGLEFMRLTGQRKCAYCGIDLTSSYESWLSIVFDHVIPASVCGLANIPREWCEDFSNTVLACAACNGFCNRYIPNEAVSHVGSLEAFYDLRDKVFEERQKLIAERHESERKFFNKKPWEVSL
jgi:hypothetical protein